MVRAVLVETRFSDCFPRARGDGPSYRQKRKFTMKFSPRPWGWSAHNGQKRKITMVFPAPVGMVRVNFDIRYARFCFPRARGDGPEPDLGIAMDLPFSPRPWGWSDYLAYLKRALFVFPAPVGMVRTPARVRFAIYVFPAPVGMVRSFMFPE